MNSNQFNIQLNIRQTLNSTELKGISSYLQTYTIKLERLNVGNFNVEIIN